MNRQTTKGRPYEDASRWWVRYSPLVALAIAMVFILLYAGVSGLLAKPSEPAWSCPQPSGVTNVTVKTGDTLWDIAGQIDTDVDRRAVVDELMKLNDMADPTVKPGMKIAICPNS